MTKSKAIIIIGAGEFAEIAYEYFTHDSPYQVMGFSVESQYLEHTTLFGLPVVPFENVEHFFSPQECEAFVAITFTKLNRVRTRLYQAAKAKGYQMASYRSSKAFIWHNVKMGENCFIFENNVIQHHATIGNNVIMWSGNHVGHRSVIEDNCFISSHVVISGYCQIGQNCFVGVNSTLNDHITIAQDCLIGSGSLIVKNTEAGKIYTGNPAVASKVDSFRYFKISEPAHSAV
jgi:sugar O-acyltransferase (sialic acid O-acetyltransferase NeuD family)